MDTGRHQGGGRFSPRAVREHISAPLFRNAYFLILSSTFTSLLGLPFWALSAHYYTAATVGKASAVFSALALISGVSCFGMPGVLTRYLPSTGARSRRFVLGSYGIAIVASLVLGALAAATSHLWSPSLRFLGTDTGWFVLFVGMAAAWSLSGLQDSVLTGLREARWVPVENILFSLAKIGLVIVFAADHPEAGIVLAWMFPLVASLIPVNLAIFVRFIPNHLRALAGAKRSWTVADVRRLMVGNFVGDFSSLLIAFFLPILVLNQAGVRQAAFFYAPWTIILGARFIPQNMATSMTVETAFDEARRREHLRDASFATARLLVPVVVFLLIAAPYVLEVFGHDYARAGTTTLRLLTLGTLPYAVAMLGLGLARIHHDGRFVGIVQGSDAAVMLVVSSLLIPRIGIEGAGIGFLAAQCVAGVLCVPRLWRGFTGRGAATPAA